MSVMTSTEARVARTAAGKTALAFISIRSLLLRIGERSSQPLALRPLAQCHARL